MPDYANFDGPFCCDDNYCHDPVKCDIPICEGNLKNLQNEMKKNENLCSNMFYLDEPVAEDSDTCPSCWEYDPNLKKCVFKRRVRKPSPIIEFSQDSLGVSNRIGV